MHFLSFWEGVFMRSRVCVVCGVCVWIYDRAGARGDSALVTCRVSVPVCLCACVFLVYCVFLVCALWSKVGV